MCATFVDTIAFFSVLSKIFVFLPFPIYAVSTGAMAFCSFYLFSSSIFCVDIVWKLMETQRNFHERFILYVSLRSTGGVWFSFIFSFYPSDVSYYNKTNAKKQR